MLHKIIYHDHGTGEDSEVEVEAKSQVDAAFKAGLELGIDLGYDFVARDIRGNATDIEKPWLVQVLLVIR